MNNSKIKKLLFILIILGLIDSGYLTYVHYAPNALICPTYGIINCSQVVTSSFSVIFFIPLAIYGLVWFIVQLILFFIIDNFDINLIWNIIGIFGVTYSILAMFFLNKICEYCSVLDFIIILIVILFFIKINRNKKENRTK